MPKYIYHCSSCNEDFEITHSIKEKMDDCLLCHKKGSTKKIPTKFNKFDEKYINTVSKINSSINENKESLKEYKDELIKRKI